MPQIKNGFTFIEMVTVIVLVGIIGLVTYPIFFSSTNISTRMYQSSQAMETAQSVFLYLRPLLKDMASLDAIASDSFTFTKDGNTYRVYVPNFSPGNAPFSIAVQKNAGAARNLASGLAELSGPTRPGFEASYTDQEGDTTAVTTNVRTIKIKMSFAGLDANHVYESALTVEGKAISLD